MDAPTAIPPLPSLADLGPDLLRISRAQRFVSVLTPFACVAAYLTFAHLRHWPLAVITLVYLSFVTYGSISHDLVHRTLGFPRRLNEFSSPSSNSSRSAPATPIASPTSTTTPASRTTMTSRARPPECRSSARCSKA